MSPKIAALKEALRALDAYPYSSRIGELKAELQRAAQAAGFQPHRLMVEWARYTVAVGEAADQIVHDDEPEPVSLAFAFATPSNRKEGKDG